jgi:hypothetical protein
VLPLHHETDRWIILADPEIDVHAASLTSFVHPS